MSMSEQQIEDEEPETPSLCAGRHSGREVLMTVEKSYRSAGVFIPDLLCNDDLGVVYVLGHAQTPVRKWRRSRLRAALAEIGSDELLRSSEFLRFCTAADSAKSLWMLPGCESVCSGCAEMLGENPWNCDDHGCAKDWWYAAEENDMHQVVHAGEKWSLPAVAFTRFDLE